jgi:PadR family transcriptional regulator PadR
MGVDMWQSQLRKGSLTLAVLASLWDGPLYGSEIRCRLERVAGIVVSEGVIYPILRRLGKTNFVETVWVEPEAGSPRRYFRLTSSGRRHASELWSRWSEFTGGMHRMLAISTYLGEQRASERESPPVE